MKYINWLVIVVGLGFLVGCGASVAVKPAPVEDRAPKMEAHDVDEILRFGGYFSELSAADREKECQDIIRDWYHYDGVGIRLHLVIAHLLTPGCGDLGHTQVLLDSVRKEVDDERLLQLTQLQDAYVKRLINEIARAKQSEEKLSISIEPPNEMEDELLVEQLKVREEEVADLTSVVMDLQSELLELQSKLDALKSIEQNINER